MYKSLIPNMLTSSNLVFGMVGYGFTLFLASFCVAALLQLLRRPLLRRGVKALLLAACFVPFFIESFAMKFPSSSPIWLPILCARAPTGFI